MSRIQSDQVALAVDNVGWPSHSAQHPRSPNIDAPGHYKLNSPTQRRIVAKPLSRTGCRAFILAGGIIPPSMDLIYAEDRRLGWWAVVLSVVVLWSLIGVVAYMVFA